MDRHARRTGLKAHRGARYGTCLSPRRGQPKRPYHSRPIDQRPPRPVQDEWGVFDPEQAGLAAVLRKLTTATATSRPEPPALRRSAARVTASSIGGSPRCRSILAIEPDRRQASQLAALVRIRLDAELLVADSIKRAVSMLGRRLPDLILTRLTFLRATRRRSLRACAKLDPTRRTSGCCPSRHSPRRAGSPAATPRIVVEPARRAPAATRPSSRRRLPITSSAAAPSARSIARAADAPDAVARPVAAIATGPVEEIAPPSKPRSKKRSKKMPKRPTRAKSPRWPGSSKSRRSRSWRWPRRARPSSSWPRRATKRHGSSGRRCPPTTAARGRRSRACSIQCALTSSTLDRARNVGGAAVQPLRVAADRRAPGARIRPRAARAAAAPEQAISMSSSTNCAGRSARCACCTRSRRRRRRPSPRPAASRLGHLRPGPDGVPALHRPARYHAADLPDDPPAADPAFLTARRAHLASSLPPPRASARPGQFPSGFAARSDTRAAASARERPKDDAESATAPSHRRARAHPPATMERRRRPRVRRVPARHGRGPRRVESGCRAAVPHAVRRDRADRSGLGAARRSCRRRGAAPAARSSRRSVRRAGCAPCAARGSICCRTSSRRRWRWSRVSARACCWRTRWGSARRFRPRSSSPSCARAMRRIACWFSRPPGCAISGRTSWPAGSTWTATIVDARRRPRARRRVAGRRQPVDDRADRDCVARLRQARRGPAGGPRVPLGRRGRSTRRTASGPARIGCRRRRSRVAGGRSCCS